MCEADEAIGGVTVPTIALVSCVKQKRPCECAARDLYTSALFLKARRFAEQHADAWYILSAKYGLLHPMQPTAPYEQTLKQARVAKRRVWAASVREQMQCEGLLQPGVQFLWLAGMDYQRDLAKLIGDWPQQDPLRGMRIGERLSWLTGATA